ncbi:hypothetical protein OS190_11265 [Sulfitobacter sp. F26204]|uniref:hypothetical protein n=1 Tax=Sulfitobacter sp. F26204 TaxID=2996014 RepID=UPI00225E039A|nr:hypothetical protein [Sulfitobacter sp. F26204]MCX7560148.1 hypothetical protein [Sulfitobacter sp. F26204]
MAEPKPIQLDAKQQAFIERFILRRPIVSPENADTPGAAVVAKAVELRADIAKLGRGPEILKALDIAIAAGDFAKAQKLLDVSQKAMPTPPLLGIWTEARSKVARQIGELEDALRSFDSPLFQRIAEFGLAAFTGKKLTNMAVAVREYDGANPKDRETEENKLRIAVNEMQAFSQNDEVLGMLDDNPLGVTLTLRQTLSEALATLEREIIRRANVV